jgi:hypothetical protein
MHTLAVEKKHHHNHYMAHNLYSYQAACVVAVAAAAVAAAVAVAVVAEAVVDMQPIADVVAVHIYLQH